jgi:HPt (histidine-containing phosphotransfer) domain-containing protein
MDNLPALHFDHDRLAQLDNLPGDLVLQLIVLFVDHTPQYLLSIQTAYSRSASEELWRSAHALKSSCLNIGASSLAKLCNGVEKHSKESDFQAVAQLMPDLLSEYSTVLSILQSQLKKYK